MILQVHDEPAFLRRQSGTGSAHDLVRDEMENVYKLAFR